MSSSTTAPRRPRWYYLPVRVVLITFLLTLVSFALCLFVGILATVIGARVHGASPDLRMAYRHIALPGAEWIGAGIFIVVTILEIRQFRQTRTLAAIEHASRNP
jgi:hypothetical protein